MATIYRRLEEREIHEHCAGLRGRVLDIGSANSEYYKLFDKSARVTRTDIDPSRGADVIFDANKRFPLKNDGFDAVLCLNLLEHLDEPQSCLDECYRVLKKGGRMFVAVPFAFPYHAGGKSKDTFRYTHAKLEEMLRQAGFKKPSVKRLGGRYSLAIESIALASPRPLAAFFRAFGALTTVMDERLLTPLERKNGKLFYLALFAEAEK